MDRLITEVLELDRKNGDVGIEIEIESKDNHKEWPAGLKDWKLTRDGSLRNNSCEYVLRHPLEIKNAHKAVDDLKKAIEDRGPKPHYSFRAGVHVHVNVQDLKVSELRTFTALYLILEGLLIDYCGEDRVGNFFCLRAEDAEFLVDFVATCFRQDRLYQLHTDAIRYAAINFKALPMYGSVEFRAMATLPDLSKIKEWATLLHNLKLKAKTINNPMNIMEDFSMIGDRVWVSEVLGDSYDLVKDNPNFELRVWTGLRLAQDFLFFSKG